MPSILIIEDDPTFQDALQQTLSATGYNVLLASDGPTGMNLLEKHHEDIDLAIIDLSLPGINGFEIIGAISRRPSNVKVIATTGIYGQSHLEAAESLGAHAVIRKPPAGARLPEKEWLRTVRQLIGPAKVGQSASRAD
jgi:CheY-like chemotaxis protein